jgi:excisionase family DNA binding protein
MTKCPESGRIITVKEAAQMLAVSGMTVRRLIDTGALPAWRVAGTGPIRLNSLDVEAMRVPVFPPDKKENNERR